MNGPYLQSWMKGNLLTNEQSNPPQVTKLDNVTKAMFHQSINTTRINNIAQINFYHSQMKMSPSKLYFYNQPQRAFNAEAVVTNQAVPPQLPWPQSKPFHKRPHKKYTPDELKQLISKYYAGAKFCEHPHPSELPQPPSHWIRDMHCKSISREGKE